MYYNISKAQKILLELRNHVTKCVKLVHFSNKLFIYSVLGGRGLSQTSKIWRDFAQLYISIANISGTDEDIDKRKTAFYQLLHSPLSLATPATKIWKGKDRCCWCVRNHLMTLHAITGCDITSAFFGQGKKHSYSLKRTVCSRMFWICSNVLKVLRTAFRWPERSSF